MLIPRSKQNRFQLSYKKGEVERYQKMEKAIMEKMGICTKSDAIKFSIRNTYQSIQKPDLVLIQVANMKQVKIGPVYYQMLVERAKRKGKNLESYLADLIAEDYGSKK